MNGWDFVTPAMLRQEPEPRPNGRLYRELVGKAAAKQECPHDWHRSGVFVVCRWCRRIQPDVVTSVAPDLSGVEDAE